jgi:hypothetical protein
MKNFADRENDRQTDRRERCNYIDIDREIKKLKDS